MMGMVDNILENMVVKEYNPAQNQITETDVEEAADIFADDTDVKVDDLDMRIFDILEGLLDELSSGKLSPDNIKLRIDMKDPESGSRFVQKYTGSNRKLFGKKGVNHELE